MYRAVATDHRLDVPVESPRLRASPGTTCIVEGMFLHRRELAGRWDYSVFLDVPFTETARRMAERDATPGDPEHPGHAEADQPGWGRDRLAFIQSASPASPKGDFVDHCTGDVIFPAHERPVP